MNPRDFCFWLSGILQMSKDDSETDKMIRQQLEEVIKRQRAAETFAVNVPQVYPATLDELVKQEKKLTGDSHPLRTYGPLHPLPGISVSELPILTEDPTGATVSDR